MKSSSLVVGALVAFAVSGTFGFTTSAIAAGGGTGIFADCPDLLEAPQDLDVSLARGISENPDCAILEVAALVDNSVVVPQIDSPEDDSSDAQDAYIPDLQPPVPAIRTPAPVIRNVSVQTVAPQVRPVVRVASPEFTTDAQQRFRFDPARIWVIGAYR